MYSLPTEIQIGDKSYAVRNQGDYRTVIECFNFLEDRELTKQERILASLMWFYGFEDIEELSVFGNDLLEAYTQMVRFFNCGKDEEEVQSTPYKLIDWEKDSLLICSAINTVAKTEIRAEKYIHWWTFMGYYMGIGECALSTIVGIRSKRAKGETLEKYERKFINENPQYFWSNKTIEEQELDEEIRRIWNNGGVVDVPQDKNTI